MNHAEFKAWLDGFLDGKESLNAEEIAKVRQKASQMFVSVFAGNGGGGGGGGKTWDVAVPTAWVNGDPGFGAAPGIPLWLKGANVWPEAEGNA